MYTSKSLTAIIASYKSTQAPYTPSSKYPKVLDKLARTLTNLALSVKGHGFDLRKIYYTYVYLDTRYPAEYEDQYRYVCPSGQVLTFSHRPFYFGKGKGLRILDHLREAANGGESYKCRVIRKLTDLRLKPVKYKLVTKLDEAAAFAFEIDAIAGIGRYGLKSGSLTNLTDGGEGNSGYEFTDEARLRVRQGLIEAWGSLTRQEYDVRCATHSSSTQKWWDSLTTTERDSIVESKVGLYKAWWYSLSTEQRKAFGDRKRLDTTAYLESLTAKEYDSWVENLESGKAAWRASLTPKEKEARGANHSNKMLAHYATVSIEERKEVAARTTATKAAKPEEEKQLTKKRKSKSAKSWYANLTEEQRVSMKAKQDKAKANYPLLACPNCGTLGKGGNMTRMHFDNCKYK